MNISSDSVMTGKEVADCPRVNQCIARLLAVKRRRLASRAGANGRFKWGRISDSMVAQSSAGTLVGEAAAKKDDKKA